MRILHNAAGNRLKRNYLKNLLSTDQQLERPIFIVGAGRSGTTLLRSLLSAHSRIAVTPETHYMKWIERHGALCDQEQNFSELWEAYMETWRFKSLGVEPARCGELAGELGDISCRNAFLAMLAAYGERLGKARVGEKSPSHARYLEQLFEWYPDARVIFMQRDPRAVIASKLKNLWVTREITPLSIRAGVLVGSRMHVVARESDAWALVYETHLPRWQDDPRVLVVAYESLVHNPEPEFRKVCELLEEPFEPEVFTNRTSETVAMPAARAPDLDLKAWNKEHNEKTLRPITTASLDKWKSELSATEAAMIEGVCEKGMAQTGYNPSVSGFRRATGRSLARLSTTGERAEAALRTGVNCGRRHLVTLVKT